jgi:hypothetical protein
MSAKQQGKQETKSQERPQLSVQSEQQGLSEYAGLAAGLARPGSFTDLPANGNNLGLRQAAVLQMQRQHGNAYVQRVLMKGNRPNLAHRFTKTGYGFDDDKFFGPVANNRNAKHHKTGQTNVQTKMDTETAVQLAPDEPTASTDVTSLPKLTRTSVYWSVDYDQLCTYVLPRHSFNLQQLAIYLYNDVSIASYLATLNNISADTQVGPGMRLRVSGSKTKGLNSPASTIAHFRAAPKIPVRVTDPVAWLLSMGVSTPEEYISRKKELDREVVEDFKYIVYKLDESHYSDSDEEKVIGILRRWAEEKLVMGKQTHFDKLLFKLQGKSKKIGWISDEVTNYYSLMFNHFDRASEIKTLVNQYSRLFRGDTGFKELSITDAVVDAVKGLPGAITMTAGAFIGMLPGRLANKASAWLNKTGKGYLKSVGWDDDMIEMSAGISGMTGMVVASLAPGGGAPAKLAQFWGKAEQIVSAMQKLIEIKNLLENFSMLKEKVLTKVETIQSFITDTDKLIPLLLGFEEDPTGIVNWVMSAPTGEEQAPGGAGKGEGVVALVQKIKDIVNKVRLGLKPVFRVRETFVELLGMVGGLIMQVPGANELLEIALDPKKRNKTNFKRLIVTFSEELSGILQSKVEFVRDTISSKIEAFFTQRELVTREMVFDKVADFAKKVIMEKHPAIGDIMNMLDPTNEQLKEHVVKKLLPDSVLNVVDTVNEKFQELLAQFQPAVTLVQDGLNAIAKGINRSLKKVLVKPITEALMRSPEDKNEPLISLSSRLPIKGHQGGISQQYRGPKTGVVQRAVDFDTLRDKLVKRFGEKAKEFFTLAKGTSKEEREKYAEIREAAARLRGREVKSPTNPELPDAYYYVPAGSGMPTGIKRKAGMKDFVPKLIIKTTKKIRRIEFGFFEGFIKEKQTEEAEEAHKAVMAELGENAEKYLKGHGGSTRGRSGGGRSGDRFSTDERNRVDAIGNVSGCHSTSDSSPGTSINTTDPRQKATDNYLNGLPNWIPDHQPPLQIWQGGGAREGIRFYPHSKAASNAQMKLVRLYKTKMMKRLGRTNSDWAAGIKSKWFWE